MRAAAMAAPVAAAVIGLSAPVTAKATPASFFFSTGSPDGLIATATRPSSSTGFEIESADDFVVTSPTTLTSATFTGLVPATAAATDVVVEIYRVFPNDSNVGRTSGPPTFSTPRVPTRVNSPSDVALVSRDSSAGQLNFSTTLLQTAFTANNSVRPGGIHPMPGQKTGGDGPVTGEEVQFSVTFAQPISLMPDHYFFVPQVLLDTTGTPNGDFLWLSAPRPILPPGTPFPAGFTALQSWTRDQFLDPDWLRVGADIVGLGAFNEAFSVTGTIPEPASLAVLGVGLAGLLLHRRAARARSQEQHG
jgi:hypothetical protein